MARTKYSSLAECRIKLADILHHFHLVFYREMQFLKHLFFSPDWCPSRLGVELVLQLSASQEFHTMIVKSDHFDVVLPLHLDHHIIGLLDLLISVLKVRRWCPLSLVLARVYK